MLNESIIKIRVELQKKDIKKSGKNEFAHFNYYELKDFLPYLNELMLEEKINDRFYIKDNIAYLELIKGEERQMYEIPFMMGDLPKGMQLIQHLGAINTYCKRYLYLNAFGITDGEVIDSLPNEEQQNKELDNLSKPANPQEESLKHYKQELFVYCKKAGFTDDMFLALSTKFNLHNAKDWKLFNEALEYLKKGGKL